MKRMLGFTLVELMISIVLGLLVSAAAVQLLVTGQRTLMMQQGSSDVQDSASFGLNRMVDAIQLANLGVGTVSDGVLSAASRMMDTSANSGIVFQLSNFPTPTGAQANMLSAGSITTDNTSLKSDQLTIQYAVPQMVVNVDPPRDCEGNLIGAGNGLPQGVTQAGIQGRLATANIFPNILVTERYFLRLDTQGSSEGFPAFALACVATHNDLSDKNTAAGVVNGSMAGLANNGQIIIPRVDHFHYLLGVLATDGSSRPPKPTIVSVTPEQYLVSYRGMPIVSIQISLLIRSQQNTSSSQSDVLNNWSILDQNVNVNSTTSATSHYIRQVYTRTISLNNSARNS